jgi:hypothetical protein
LPPFGPPEAGPRPRPGRSSPAQRTPSSSGSDQRAENATPHCLDTYAGPRNGESYSGGKRRTGSRISMYGNDGEVTHTHLTGPIGLPPRCQRRRRKS